MVDECAHEGHRRLLATRWHPLEPQGPVIMQGVPRGIENVCALSLATWTVMWSRWRAVSESSGTKGATYCVTALRIARMTFCTTFGSARMLRCQWCTAARRTRCLRCRENSPSGCRYPVPWVFQEWADAQP